MPDHDRGFVAESSQRLIGFQDARDVECDDDHDGDDVRADPFGGKEHQRGDENGEEPELLRTEIRNTDFS